MSICVCHSFPWPPEKRLFIVPGCVQKNILSNHQLHTSSEDTKRFKFSASSLNSLQKADRFPRSGVLPPNEVFTPENLPKIRFSQQTHVKHGMSKVSSHINAQNVIAPKSVMEDSVSEGNSRRLEMASSSRR